MEVRLRGSRSRLKAMSVELQKRYGVAARLYASSAGDDARLYFHIDDDAADALLDRLAASGHAKARQKGSSS